MWGKAAALFRQATTKAVARSASREAVTCFEHALAAVGHFPESRDTLEQAIDLRTDLHSALAPLGEFSRTLHYLREAESLAEALGDQRRLGLVSAHMTYSFFVMGDPDRAVESGERALTVATSLGDLSLELLSSLHMGRVYFIRGELRRGVDILTRSVEALQGDLAREFFGLGVLPAVMAPVFIGWGLALLGDFAAAATTAENGLRVAEAANHQHSLAYAYLGLAVPWLAQGNLPRAISWLERSRDLCQRSNFPAWLLVVLPQLGLAYAFGGRVPEGLTLLEQAAERSASIKLIAIYPKNLTDLSEAYLLAGRSADAMQSLERALHLSRAHKQRWVEGDALRVLGDILAARDSPAVEKAEAAYREALALAEELGMRPLAARCHLGLGKLYRRAGMQPQAVEHLTTVAAMLREMGMRFWLEKAEVELGALA